MSYSDGEDAESSRAPHLKFMTIDSLGAPIVRIASPSPSFSPSFSPAPSASASRKRNISAVDTSTSTDLDLLHHAKTVPALPIAPLPKRRRIVRDLGHVTLGFGLGVVAAVAGLSALSGAIQAMVV